MCDNNNGNNVKSLIQKDAINSCHPCNNDPVGCTVSNIRHVMANNLSIKTCYQNMKCALLAYINSVSIEFVQNVDHESEPGERERFNVLIESLIAGIHQSVKSSTGGQLEPYFQLWVQDSSSGTDLWDIGSGSVNQYNAEPYCLGNSSADITTCGNATNDTTPGTATCQESTDGGNSYTASSFTSNLDTNCVDGCSDGTSTTKIQCEASLTHVLNLGFGAVDLSSSTAGDNTLKLEVDGVAIADIDISTDITNVTSAVTALNTAFSGAPVAITASDNGGNIKLTSDTDNVSIKFLSTSGADIKTLFDTAVETLSTGSPHTWTNRYIDEEWQVNGGEGKCSDTSLKSREECLQNVDLFGNTNKWSMHEIGNLAKLFPNKIALFLNCNKTNGVRGDEVLYHYNPSVQLLYNPADSSLKLRWIDATYSETAYQQKCLFPLLSNEENYKSEVLTIVPSSAVGDENVPGDSIWEDNVLAFNFIRKNCLLDNKDLHRLIHNIDSSIRKCELAHQSLKLKLKSAGTEMGIDAFDPVNSGLY